MPPESFIAGRVGEGLETGTFQQIGNARLPLPAALSKQPAKKSIFSKTDQGGIEVLAKTLRHIGDTRAGILAVAGIGHVAAQTQKLHLALLDGARAGDERQRLDLPTPSGPISPIIRPAGISTDMSASAMALPKVNRTSANRATGALLSFVTETRPWWPPSLDEIAFEVFRPDGLRIKPDIGHAGQPGFDILYILLQQLLRDLCPHRNVSFWRSSSVSTVFGVNWATSRRRKPWRGWYIAGRHPISGAHPSPMDVRASLSRRQEKRHIDIGEIDEAHNPSTGG